MMEKVQLSSDGKYIHVLSSGPASVAEMEKTLSQIAMLSSESGIRKVLVDSRARTGRLTMEDLYKGGVMLSEKLGPLFSIAVLVMESMPEQDFFEDVALNRGINIAYFQQMDSALDWLQDGSS